MGASTYERIRHDIIFGSLRPGVKLKLDPLRKNYGISVTTLREILNRLVSEGFVWAEEQRGFFVSSVSRVDLIEISNLRIYPPSYSPFTCYLLLALTPIILCFLGIYGHKSDGPVFSGPVASKLK